MKTCGVGIRTVLIHLSFALLCHSAAEVNKDALIYNPRDGVVRLYGAGGPHTVLLPVADLFTQETGVAVEVIFGPESKWTQDARRNADIIWGTSEQSTAAYLETYTEFKSSDVEPVYFKRAVIAVQKGNPRNIKGFDDLLAPGMKIVVTEGAGVYNTSGTGVWEDIAGRLGSLDDVKACRKNIIAFAKGSGASFRAFKEGADAWITWIHWPLSHPESADVVELSPERAIYRDFTVVTNEKADPEAAEFIKFLQSEKAAEIFKSKGYSR